LSLRPLGYEQYDAHLRRLGRSLAGAVTSPDGSEYGARGLLRLPCLTPFRGVRFTNRFTCSGHAHGSGGGRPHLSNLPGLPAHRDSLPLSLGRTIPYIFRIMGGRTQRARACFGERLIHRSMERVQPLRGNPYPRSEGWGLLTGHQRGPRPGHTRDFLKATDRKRPARRPSDPVGVGKSSKTVGLLSWAGPIFQSCPTCVGPRPVAWQQCWLQRQALGPHKSPTALNGARTPRTSDQDSSTAVVRYRACHAAQDLATAGHGTHTFNVRRIRGIADQAAVMPQSSPAPRWTHPHPPRSESRSRPMSISDFGLSDRPATRAAPVQGGKSASWAGCES
jgi:hypothetical protein